MKKKKLKKKLKQLNKKITKIKKKAGDNRYSIEVLDHWLKCHENRFSELYTAVEIPSTPVTGDIFSIR